MNCPKCKHPQMKVTNTRVYNGPSAQNIPKKQKVREGLVYRRRFCKKCKLVLETTEVINIPSNHDLKIIKRCLDVAQQKLNDYLSRSQS